MYTCTNVHTYICHCMRTLSLSPPRLHPPLSLVYLYFKTRPPCRAYIMVRKRGSMQLHSPPSPSPRTSASLRHQLTRHPSPSPANYCTHHHTNGTPIRAAPDAASDARRGAGRGGGRGGGRRQRGRVFEPAFESVHRTGMGFGAPKSDYFIGWGI